MNARIGVIKPLHQNGGYSIIPNDFAQDRTLTQLATVILLDVASRPPTWVTNVTTINNVSSPYTHTQLSNDADYYYAVTVVFEDGESQLSVVIPGSPLPPPGKPSQMTLVATTEDVTLQWNEVNGATSYSLYLAAEPYISKENIRTLQGWAIVDNVNSPYTYTGMIPGVTYYFALVASNDGGQSILSNEVAGILLPEAPGDLRGARLLTLHQRLQPSQDSVQ